MLHTTWHQYSSIPFSFESIPPEADDGTTISNVDCWFFGSTSASQYWSFIFANQDFFAIDEWRYHFGVADWATMVSGYDVAHLANKKIIIGETFNLNVANTQQLMDAFNIDGMGWLGQSVNYLAYAFWWMASGSEPDASGSSAPGSEPFVYFNGGYEGHNWAFLNYQTVSPNNIPGNGIAVIQTYGNGNGEFNGANDYVNFNTNPSNEQMGCYFNLDASTLNSNL